ncbi:MAG TPA: nucleotidyltransferase family protein [Nitrososphaera sp.]|nr:nucleotidyltransferase family protein [Nitrososphaera sp.]
MKAVILAGGLGTRLQPYTFFIPKPMLPLGNKPLLEYIIEWLKNAGGVDSIVVCVSYLHRTIEDYFEDGARFGVEIEYARSERPLATAGQLKTAEKLLDDSFVCVYGDSVYEFNLRKMIKEHKESRAFVSMSLMAYTTKLKYGFIDVNGQDRVTSWREKPEISGLINVGCYVMDPEFLKLIPKSGSFGMDDAVRKALEQKKIVKGFKIDTGFIDIGDKKSYLDAYKQYANKLGKI